MGLRPEWNGPCAAATPVDVNLGNAPESFVRAAYCQITGTQPPMATVMDWANQLRTVSYVRRVDVVRCYARMAGVLVPISFESVASVLIAGHSTFKMTFDYEIINGQRMKPQTTP